MIKKTRPEFTSPCPTGHDAFGLNQVRFTEGVQSVIICTRCFPGDTALAEIQRRILAGETTIDCVYTSSQGSIHQCGDGIDCPLPFGISPTRFLSAGWRPFTRLHGAGIPNAGERVSGFELVSIR